MTTPNGHLRSTSYSRRIGDYVRPPSSLRLDGTLSYYAKTGHENEDVLHALPTGVEIDVDVVPEPGNPHDSTALALDVNETRVGYVPRWLSGRLFPAVTAANAGGLHVLVRAKMHPVRSWRELVVRSSDGADLRTWLMVTPDPPGDSFYEFDWTKPGRQFAFQDGISAVVAGADESTLFTCECVPALDRGPSSVDIVIAGRCVGQFSRFAGGGQAGLARFHRWPDNIEIKILVPLADGTWPRSSQRFAWKT
jgi:hypothetical protein